MARPKKVDSAEQTALDTDFVEIDHFAEAGSMTIGDTEYEIKDGKVAVKPEHVARARRHIAMGS
jgi:hypothetical protein